MKTIYFIRHGESKANLEGIAAGGELDTPLTDKGRAQAKQTAQDLKGKKIDLIVSSPMERALETAKIIAREIGYDPEKVVTNSLFVERGIGIYSNRPIDDFRKAFNDRALHESVEAVEDLVKRVANGLEWLIEQKAERIILVSHSDINGALQLIHQKLDHTHLYKVKEYSNAEIYKFTIE